MPLKEYKAAQKDKTPTPAAATPSGVACTEKTCDGEMMYVEPPQRHPEIPSLRRAVCGKCGWRGWC